MHAAQNQSEAGILSLNSDLSYPVSPIQLSDYDFCKVANSKFRSVNPEPTENYENGSMTPSVTGNVRLNLRKQPCELFYDIL